MHPGFFLAILQSLRIFSTFPSICTFNRHPRKMAKVYFFGLTGHKLRTAQLWAVIMPAFILFGYNQAVAGGLLGLPTWVETFPRIDTSTDNAALNTHNSRIQGAVVALYTLGAMFGALSCIPLGDRLGRLRMMQLGSAVHIVGSILQASSFSLGQLIVSRLVDYF